MPEHILSLSYGKDSMACFGACEILGWPIDRVVTAEVWATDTIHADLPPMVEFKAKADRIIKERWGIEVEHIRCRNTYQDVFYRRKSTRAKKNPGQIRGWPMRGGPGGAWCQGDVKLPVLREINKRRDRNVMYLGIAADEPDRSHILCSMPQLGGQPGRWAITSSSPTYSTQRAGQVSKPPGGNAWDRLAVCVGQESAGRRSIYAQRK